MIERKKAPPILGKQCSFCGLIIDLGSENWLTHSETGERYPLHVGCHVRIVEGLLTQPVARTVEDWLQRIGVTAAPVHHFGPIG